MTAVTDERPTLDGYWFTTVGEQWWRFFRDRMERAERPAFDAAVAAQRKKHGAPKIGGNHVLLAVVDLGLYQQVTP